MTGDFFEGNKKEQFKLWIKKVIGQDDRFKHLLEPDYEEERLDFYNYFEKNLSPYQALQEEYRKYG